jgi:hypothetical protein
MRKKDVFLPRCNLGVEDNHAKTLPKTLPGVVLEQWVRCGRPNCGCVSGTKHGPYFYRFWREHGRLRKTYVPRDSVETVRGQCRARQDEQRDERRSEREALEFLRGLRNYLREVEHHGQGDDAG